MDVEEEFKSFLAQGGGLGSASLQDDFVITVERFVAFLDIMGFKDKVARHNHDEILQDLRGISDFLSQQHPKEQGINYAMFSDSLLFYTDNNSKEQLKSLCNIVKELLIYATDIKIPFKGAISKGILTADSKKQLYFGQPLIDAYLIGEEILIYGVVAHHTIENDAKDIDDGFINKDVPLRSGHSCHYILNWYREEEKVKNALTRIREDVSGTPRRYIDNTLALFSK